MKKNPYPVIGEVAESARIGFDELDDTVESFCTGVANSMLAAVEQPFIVAVLHLEDLPRRLQAVLIALFNQAHLLPVNGKVPAWDILRCSCFLTASTASPRYLET